jgi:serine/threonine protein phosphatase PrpC
MSIQVAAFTDKGSFRTVNQDSYCFRVADTDVGSIAFAVVCDGMGGLKEGEYASASVVMALADWFDHELTVSRETGFSDFFQATAKRWNEIIEDQNAILLARGREIGASLGTTCSAILLVSGAGFVAVHIGDTRIYRIGVEMERLTEDHTLVADDVRKGLITEFDGERDPRRNVLSQCVGANDYLNPLFLRDMTPPKGWYLLCTDGFRHEVSESEMRDAICYADPKNEAEMQGVLKNLTDMCMHRGETDNITSLLLKV